MIEVNVATSNNADKWNSIVEINPHASTYHLWEWGEALASTYRYQRYYLVGIKEDNIVGALPLIHVKSLLFGNKLISLPLCEFGGPLVDSELNNQETRQVIRSLLNATSKLARKLRVDYVEIRKCSVVVRGFMDNKDYAKFQRYVTFRIDLTKGLKELWVSLHKTRTRKSVRKAMKSGIVTREIEKAEQLKEYYILYLKAMKGHGSPPHKYELFEKLYDVFHQQGKMKILLAEYEGKPIGGLITFCHGKTIFDWNSVTDIKYRSLNSHSLLLWSIIEWGVRNGYRTFDFGRTRKGTTIFDFKSGWGGQEIYVEQYVYSIDSRPKELVDPTQEKYRYFSKVWSLVPISLTKKIGPKIVSGIGL